MLECFILYSVVFTIFVDSWRWPRKPGEPLSWRVPNNRRGVSSRVSHVTVRSEQIHFLTLLNLIRRARWEEREIHIYAHEETTLSSADRDNKGFEALLSLLKRSRHAASMGRSREMKACHSVKGYPPYAPDFIQCLLRYLFDLTGKAQAWPIKRKLIRSLTVHRLRLARSVSINLFVRHLYIEHR